MILDGRKISEQIIADLAVRVAAMTADGTRPPHLVAVLVGNEGASETYVAAKMRACERCGFTSTTLRLDVDVTEEHLLQLIESLNSDTAVDGLIVQLPLPPHIDEHHVIAAIDPDKDVDGFHPTNVGRLSIGVPGFVGATPKGIMTLIEHYGIATDGHHAVVVGRSNIVGRPVATLLSLKAAPGNCTVTLCHSGTPDLARFTREADILVTAVGNPGFITADMVKPGAVVFDVGITRVPDPTSRTGYRLRGDVDYDAVEPMCAAITPVPGGVGPMTIATLMQNTLQAYLRRGAVECNETPDG